MIADAFAIENPFTLQVGYARADEYFSSIWQMHEETLFGLVERCQGMNLALHVEQHARPKQAGDEFGIGGNPVEFTPGGVAVISLTGPLMKQTSSLSGGTSTVAARRQIRSAANSSEVKAILLRIESPGGTSAGTPELAQEVADAAKRKPVWAFAEDMMASAAYGIGSRAERVVANATALVGAIGTYAVISDASGRAAQLGVKVHVVRAGKFKGMGTAGTEVTPEMLAEWQRMVDSLNAHYLDGIAAGRKPAGLSRKAVEALADGRVYVGQEAKEVGLIDDVQSYDATLAQMTKLVSSQSPSRSKSAMSADTPAAPVAASFRELKASLHGADADFLASCQEKELPLTAAQTAWMKELDDRLAKSEQKVETLQAENAELKQKLEAAQAAKPKPGFAPHAETKPGSQAEGSGDAISAFNEAVAEKVKAGMPKAKAVGAVIAESPQLHQEYLAAANARRR